MLTRQVVLLCIGVLLSSCAIDDPKSIYPLFHKNTPKELVAAGKSAKDSLPTPSVDNARLMLDGLYSLLDDAAHSRQTSSVLASELLYYGTVMGVLGATLDSRAARNTGAGVAAIAELFSGHYKTSDQQVQFEKAVKRVDCARTAIFPLTTKEMHALFPNDLDDVPPPSDDQVKSGVKDAPTAFADIPEDTIAFTNKVQDDLKIALAKIPLSSPSKDDLKKTVDAWDAARKPPEKDKLPGDPTLNQKINNVSLKINANSGLLKQFQAQAHPLQIQAKKELSLGNLDAAKTTFQMVKDQEHSAADDLTTAQGDLEKLQQQATKLKGEQAVFVSALYSYKPTLDLCLQQDQQ